MKFRLLFLLLIAAAFQTRATHLMGGDIVIRPDSAQPGKYYVKVVHYRDTGGIMAAGNLTYFLHNWDPVTNTWVGYSQSFLNLDFLQSGQNIPNFPYGVEVNTYTTTYFPLQLAPGKYRLVVTECCRNGAILNMSAPLTESMTLSAEITVPATGTNTTPQFLAMPIVYLPVNQPWSYNPLPYDVNGDSISWAMTVPNSALVSPSFVPINPVAGYTQPAAAASGPFTLNPVTGEVTWTPNTTGHFVASFTITEYKNGVPAGNINRDMQYVVINSSVPPPFFTTVTPYNSNNTAGYKYVNYVPGQPLQFKIRGGDGTNAAIRMECFTGLSRKTPASTFSYLPAGSGNTVEGTFAWTPPAGYKEDEVVVFRIGNGTFSKDFTLMLRNAATTGIAEAAQGPLSSLTAYPNPAGHTLNVSLRSAAAADLQLQLVDVTGRVARRLFSGNIPKGQWQMGFGLNEPNGLYFLQALSGGQVVATERISVVQ